MKQKQNEMINGAQVDQEKMQDIINSQTIEQYINAINQHLLENNKEAAKS